MSTLAPRPLSLGVLSPLGRNVPLGVRTGVAIALPGPVAPPPQAPVNMVLPVITPGALFTGTAATCSTGTWLNGVNTFNYQWQRDGGNISGATSSGYTPVTADNGHVLTCQVTAINDHGSLVVASAGITVQALVPVNTVTPALSASTVVNGNAITCGTGTWANGTTTFAYQWLRNGTPISGATTSSHTAVLADVGQTLTCVVTASNVNGAGTAAPSGPASVTPNTGAPQFTSQAGVDFNTTTGWSGFGDQITFFDIPSAGLVTISISFRNQGTTQTVTFSTDAGSDITLTPDEPGASVRDAFISFLGYGLYPTPDSFQFPAQYPSEFGSTTLSSTGGGGVTPGDCDTFAQAYAVNGTVTGSPTPSVANQWLLCDAGGGSPSPISGATSSALVMRPEWAGSTVRLQQTASNVNGTAVSTSDPSSVIVITP